MGFYEILDQVVELLRQRGRVSYRALQRAFDLDEDVLEDMKMELIEAQQVARDENGRILVWIDEAESEAKPPLSAKPQSEGRGATYLSESRPSVTSQTTAAERRQLTVMFCDLVGSTQLSGQLDPEDLREVIRAYQECAVGVIQQYEGYIAQYLGDGLLVYFGYPFAHEDDARRAIHTGLGIVKAMGALNARLVENVNIRLDVRIAIHTGAVVVGEMGGGGRHEQLALGEAPIIAARLEGLAQANTIVVSDATHRLIQGYFACEDLGIRALKGLSKPIQVFQVREERGAQDRLDVAVEKGLTPLVGRDSEVALLLERWSQVKESMGQVILLHGEAGIGKSRLVQAIKDHIVSESHTQLECHSSPYYQHTALYPIVDLLQRALQFQPHETSEGKLARLEQGLGAYRLPLAETVPLLASLLSISLPEERYAPLALSPKQKRQKTLETIAALVLELAEREPVLLILEDLHWADPTTLDWLNLVIEQAPTASIFLILTHRPEFQPPWSNRSHLMSMALNRFSHSQVEQISAHLANGRRLPPTVLEQIIEKSDGVPLFIEELTKTILESGQLKKNDGHYELIGSLTTVSIPSTLQDALMARLDRLGQAKTVAQWGATLGRQFSSTLLQAVVPFDELTLWCALVQLVQAEIIYQRGTPPQATYLFKHALIRDTAYQSLLNRTRQQYHQQIAEVLATQFLDIAETQPEIIAHHYTEAGQPGPAVHYWHKAGRQAIEHFAYSEAIAHLSKGLDVVATLPDLRLRNDHELELRLTLAPVLSAVKGSGSQEMLHAYWRTRELCQQVGDQRQLAIVLTGLRRFHLMRCEWQASCEAAEELLQIAQRLDDIPLCLHAHHELANSLIWWGRLSRTRDQLEQAIHLYDQVAPQLSSTIYGGGDTLALCLVQHAIVLWLMGFPDQAHTAIGHLETGGQAYNQAVIGNWMAWLHHYRRDVIAVQTQAELALNLSLEHSMGHRAAQARILRGWAEAMQGAMEEGLAEVHQGLAAYRATESINMLPYFLTLLAEIYQQDNRILEGLSVLHEALELAQASGGFFWEAEIHRLEGETRLRLSPPEISQAEHCFHQALEVARQQQAKSLELRAAASLARLWQSQGKRQEAYEALAPVYNWFSEGFDTTHLQETMALLQKLE